MLKCILQFSIHGHCKYRNVSDLLTFTLVFKSSSLLLKKVLGQSIRGKTLVVFHFHSSTGFLAYCPSPQLRFPLSFPQCWWNLTTDCRNVQRGSNQNAVNLGGWFFHFSPRPLANSLPIFAGHGYHQRTEKVLSNILGLVDLVDSVYHSPKGMGKRSSLGSSLKKFKYRSSARDELFKG